MDGCMDRQADKQTTHIQTEMQADRQADRQTETFSDRIKGSERKGWRKRGRQEDKNAQWRGKRRHQILKKTGKEMRKNVASLSLDHRNLPEPNRNKTPPESDPLRHSS